MIDLPVNSGKLRFQAVEFHSQLKGDWKNSTQNGDRDTVCFKTSAQPSLFRLLASCSQNLNPFSNGAATAVDRRSNGTRSARYVKAPPIGTRRARFPSVRVPNELLSFCQDEDLKWVEENIPSSMADV